MQREVGMGSGVLQEVFLLRRKAEGGKSKRTYSREGRKVMSAHELFSQVQPCIVAY